MARSRVLDYLQDFRFHLLDVSTNLVPQFSASSPDQPLPLFLPVAGFTGASSPELTIEVKEVVEGNFRFKRKFPSKASVGEVTLSRGLTFFDTDFWRWISSTVQGQINRRNLLLIQFSGLGLLSPPTIPGVPASVSNRFAVTPQLPSPVDFANGIFKVPGKSWLLRDCFPSRYRPTSDLAASSSEVSVAELDVTFESFEEFALGS